MKDDRIYLQHIRDALDDIADYASGGRDAFLAERMRQDATIRKLQVIGPGSREPFRDPNDTPAAHVPFGACDRNRSTCGDEL